MMKIFLLSMTLLYLATPAIAGAAGWSGNANALLGMKFLDDSDWGGF